MNWIDTLQELHRQFPRSNEPHFCFPRVEKYLRDVLGVGRVALLQRINGKFEPPAGHEKASNPFPANILRTLEKKKKPWFAAGKRDGPWCGLWPVWVEGELCACFAIGWKPGGKTLTTEQKKIVEFAVDRTELLFREHCLWKHLDTSNRLASLGLMSAALVHEVRNPLTALSTLAQLLPSKKSDERFMETFEKLMLQEILRLTTLTETFLNFSKADFGKTGAVDITQTVDRVLQLLGPLFSAKHIDLKARTGPCLLVKGDSAQIESLVLNLLQNSIQSIEPKGTIEISARLLRRDPCGPGAWIRLQVKDNGRGISKENLHRLFIPFFSTKCEGTGLGLFICRKIVENHRGILRTSSHPGKGAIFSVFLPAIIKKR